MRHIIFFIAILFGVFFNTSIAVSLGFEKLTTVAFLPMILYIGFSMFTQKLKYDKEAVFLIVLAVVVIIFQWAVDQDYFKKMLELLLIPMFISVCFESLNKKEISLLFKIIIIFYLAECGLSIVERVLNQNFLLHPEDDTDYWLYFGFFRSSSLMGHPLANAQIVAVFMTFIAIHEFKKKSFQIFLFFLGYVSLFCFNVRGSTLVVTLLAVPYFIWKINKIIPKNRKWMMNLGLICVFCGMILTITLTPLGGRLMNMKLMDSSAQTRLEVFEFYKYYRDIDDFLWGSPDNYDYMVEKLGGDAAGVENGVITVLLGYGIIFTIPMLLLLFWFQYRKLSVYSNLEKWLLLAVFFLISCMNPNLASPTQWILWIYAYYAFRPEPSYLQVANDEPLTFVNS